MQDVSQLRGMGAPMPRVDGRDKVTGRTAYTTDIPLQGLLWGKALRSTHAHARIVRIDVTSARALPGVHAILTGDDLSGVRFGRYVIDVPVLADGVVRFIGEQVAAVAAVDEETAERALALIDVAYDPLPAVFDATEAMQPDAVVVHPGMSAYAGLIPPAGAPTSVECLIHSGSSAGFGGGCCAVCVPGMKRIAPIRYLHIEVRVVLDQCTMPLHCRLMYGSCLRSSSRRIGCF